MKIAKAPIDQGRERMTTGRKALWLTMSSPTNPGLEGPTDRFSRLIHSSTPLYRRRFRFIGTHCCYQSKLFTPSPSTLPKVRALIDHFNIKTLDKKKAMIREIQLMLSYALALDYDQRHLAILHLLLLGIMLISFGFFQF